MIDIWLDIACCVHSEEVGMTEMGAMRDTRIVLYDIIELVGG